MGGPNLEKKEEIAYIDDEEQMKERDGKAMLVVTIVFHTFKIEQKNLS